MSLSAAAVRLPNVQDAFLSNLRRCAIPVTLFLINGYQMRGIIHSFDPYVVVLMSESRQNVIYKHAISTIVPERPVKLERES